jgi:hypothetical protein
LLRGDFRPPARTRKNLLILSALGLAGLSGTVVTAVIAAFVLSAWLGLPLDVFGMNEGPDQPIAFPHTVHAGDIGLDCTFCHRNVTQGAAASIPSVALCMTCHRVVGDELAEVVKLRGYAERGEPINWVRVHRVPDHAHFVHDAHINFFSEKDDVVASATCVLCHGDVAAMTKVKQVRSLKMGDCVDCHRDNGAPTDCTTCHY